MEGFKTQTDWREIKMFNEYFARFLTTTTAKERETEEKKLSEKKMLGEVIAIQGLREGTTTSFIDWS